jgi:hypothetical protein
VRDRDCDAVVVNYGDEDAAQYAERWNPAGLGGQSHREREATIRRWVRYYESLEIATIALGAVVLRRRSNGRKWIHTVRPKTAPVGSASSQLLRIFSGLDHSIARPDDVLMADRFQLTSDYRLQQRCGSQILMSRLGLEATVEPPVLEVLEGCDGRDALGDVVTSVSARNGMSPAILAAAATRVIRQLFEIGLIRERDDRASSPPGETKLVDRPNEAGVDVASILSTGSAGGKLRGEVPDNS